VLISIDMNGSRFLPVVFLMALSTIGWSQAPTIDSLKRVISKTKIDSVKVNSLIELSKVYLDIDLNQAIEYGKQARKLAKKADFKKGQGNAYKAIAIGYYRQSNYPEAIVQYQNALDIYQKIDFKLGIANILGNMFTTIPAMIQKPLNTTSNPSSFPKRLMIR